MRFLRADRAAPETARLWRSRMRPQLLPDPARLLDLGSGVSDSHSPGGSSCEVALRRPDNHQADGRILFPDVHCPGLSLLICGISFPVKRIGDSLASLLEMRVYRNGPDRYTHLRFQCPAGKIAQKSACGTALLKASPHARSSVCKVRLENPIPVSPDHAYRNTLSTGVQVQKLSVLAQATPVFRDPRLPA